MDWREMMLVRPHAELPEVLAGARGELSLRRVMGRHQASRFGHSFGGKRGPRDPTHPTAGRYEIDLIVVTPRRIAIVEVKLLLTYIQRGLPDVPADTPNDDDIDAPLAFAY